MNFYYLMILIANEKWLQVSLRTHKNEITPRNLQISAFSIWISVGCTLKNTLTFCHFFAGFFFRQITEIVLAHFHEIQRFDRSFHYFCMKAYNT